MPRRNTTPPPIPCLKDFLAIAPRRPVRFSYRQHSGKIPPAYRWSYSDGKTLREEAAYFAAGSFCWYSPALYKGGRRLDVAVRSMDCIALDFDDGLMTLNNAKAEYGDCIGVLHTTKSHQVAKEDKSAVDRFRAVLQLSRRVDPDEYSTLWQLLVGHIYPGYACDGAKGISQCYRCGGWSMPLDGGHDLDVKKMLGYCKAHGIRGDDPVAAAAPVSVTLRGTADWRVKRSAENFAKAHWKDWDRRGMATCRRFFAVAVQSFRTCPDPDTVAASLLEVGWIEDWVQRKKRDYLREIGNACRAFRTRYLRASYIAPLMPPEGVEEKEWNTETLPDIPAEWLATRAGYRNINGYAGTARGDLTYRLFGECAKGGRHIIAAPCGAEKTSAMRTYAATYASQQRPVWVVKQTVAGALEERAELEKIGVAPQDIAVVRGWDAGCCNALTGGSATADEWRDYYRKAHTCLNCPAHDRCEFYWSRHRVSLMLRKPIVLMTHRRFTMLANQNQGDSLVNPQALVVIDERLQDVDGLRIAPRAWRTSGIADYVRIMDDIFELCADGGAHSVSEATWLDGVSKPSLWLLKAQQQAFADDWGGTEEEAEAVADSAAWLRRYRHNAFCVADGAGLRFAARTYNPAQDGHPDIVVLDASAHLARTAWKDFTLHGIGEQRQSFPQTRLHVVWQNPTKAALDRNAALWVDAAKAATAGRVDVFMCENKVASPTVDAIKDALAGRHITTLKRGQIVGSNKARGSDACVIAMSLFGDVPAVALATAVAENVPVEAHRIWKTTANGTVKPRWNEQGFEDAALAATYRRLYADDLYQTIMRGCIRVNPGADYHVVAPISDVGILLELHRRLRGWKYGGAYGHKRAQEAVMGFCRLKEAGADELLSYAEAARVLGLKPSKRVPETVRALVAALADSEARCEVQS